MEKLMQWKGEDNRVSYLFYMATIQAVLMFGLEYWEMSYATMGMVERTHVRFLQKITGKRERRQAERLWETTAAEEVL